MDGQSSIAKWIRELPVRGEYTFSREDVDANFPDMNPSSVSRALTREVGKGVLFMPQKGFYVIFPDEYKARGVIPQSFYMDGLMRHLGRDYYVALLSAADLHGAAHQAPMSYSVMIEPPAMRDKVTPKYVTRFVLKSKLPMRYVEKRVVRTGYLNVSSPELTAVDLITYQHNIGGLTRAATVLAELASKLHFDLLDEGFIGVAPLASFQRMGYILENVLEESAVAAKLFELVSRHDGISQYVPLRRDKASAGHPTDKKWKVIINTEIDIDDL